GWVSGLARLSMALLIFEAASGLLITFGPFHAAVQWSVLVHTLAGVAMLLPLAWYCSNHLREYKRYTMSYIVLLGYVGLVALALCAFSGLVVTCQGFWGIRSSELWRKIHLVTTFATAGTILPHVLSSLWRVWREGGSRPVGVYWVWVFGGG